MKTSMLRIFCLAGALTALALAPLQAQIVEFRATINSAQETTGSTSVAAGWAVLLYDVSTNKFDLTIIINGFAATLSASHIHEGAPGVAGPVVTNLGGEAVTGRLRLRAQPASIPTDVQPRAPLEFCVAAPLAVVSAR